MLRRLGCVLIVLGYWTFTVFLLRYLSPVYFDGAGPMPSYYSGRVPTPDLAEYHRHQSHYDSVYDQPYRISAAGITVMGVILPILILRRTARALQALLRSSALSAMLLTFAAVVSDIGTIHQQWSGPLFLLHGQFDPRSVLILTGAILLLSLLGAPATIAALALWRRRTHAAAEPGCGGP